MKPRAPTAPGPPAAAAQSAATRLPRTPENNQDPNFTTQISQQHTQKLSPFVIGRSPAPYFSVQVRTAVRSSPSFFRTPIDHAVIRGISCWSIRRCGQCGERRIIFEGKLKERRSLLAFLWLVSVPKTNNLRVFNPRLRNNSVPGHHFIYSLLFIEFLSGNFARESLLVGREGKTFE